VKPNEPIYDIGEKTCEKYGEIIKDARTGIMKGPMGAFLRYLLGKLLPGIEVLMNH